MPTPQRKNSRPWAAPLVALIIGATVIASAWLLASSARDVGLARAAALTPTTVEATVAPTPSGEVCYTECEWAAMMAKILEEQDSCDLDDLAYILETFFGGSASDLLTSVQGEFGFDARIRLEMCDLDARVRREGPVVTTTQAPPSTVIVVVTVPSPTTTTSVVTTTTQASTTTTSAVTTTTQASTTTITSPPPCTGNPDDNCENEGP